MGYMSVSCSGSGGSAIVYVACAGEVKSLADSGELKTFDFPHVIATKDNGEEVGDGQPEKEEQASGRVLGLCASPSGRLVAALNDRKTACVWRAEDGTKIASWQTSRKASCLTFSRDEHTLLLADKSGDIYKCQLGDPETKPQLILGHISMVLDMYVTADGRRLLTCDRDEKIRVTCYPNTWTIDAYCLGHSEFVAALCLTPHGRLVSGGGDMTVRLWDPTAGRQLACCPVAADGNSSSDDAQKVAVVAVVAVETESGCLLVVQVHSWSRLAVFAVTAYSLTPLPALELPAAPWALSAAAGCLYVLRPDPAQPLAVFAAEGGRLSLLPGGPQADAAATLWPRLKETFEVPEQVTWLFKQWFDNVASYMSKKEERLKGEKKDSEDSSPKKRKTSSE